MAITADDIRMFLIDRDSDDNFLLDAVEFDDAQIEKAMSMALDRYNEMTPLLGMATELPNGLWTSGTVAILFRMRAINMTRNRLDYQQKSGAAVQDKNKAVEYLTLAREFINEFDQRAKLLKVSANVESCYGYMGSQYRYPGGVA